MNLFLMIILISWLPCFIFTYLVLRWDWKSAFDEWTLDIRRKALFLSLFGPISAGMAIFILLAGLVEGWSKKHDGPAKW